jgi:hypothetical protein
MSESPQSPTDGQAFGPWAPPPASPAAAAPTPAPGQLATSPWSPEPRAVNVAARGPASGAPLGKDRSPAAVIGLSIITLGIYYLVWYGSLNAEIRRHDPSIKVSPGWAVVALFFPVSNIVSSYATAARLRQLQLDCGQTQTISPVVALLLFLFLGIGYPLYLASQAREHWHGHRRLAGV